MNPNDPRPSAPAETLETVYRRAPKNRLLWIAVVVAVMAVGLVIVGVMARSGDRRRLVTETDILAVPTVTVVSPVAGKSSGSLLLPAEVRPFQETPIYARASGFVKRFAVDLGAEVKAGDILAELDTPELNQELAKARADLVQSESAYKLAKSTAERWVELRRGAIISEQELNEKQSDMAVKSAAVESARAGIGRLEDLVGFAKITAPFDGVVNSRRVDVGDLVSAGTARELFRLVQIQKLRVFVRVPQASARGIRMGGTADLVVPELPGRIFAARVVRNAGAMSADTRTLLVELEVDNPKREILAGSFAQVRLDENHPEAILTLPANTLLFRVDGTVVAVAQPNGSVQLRKILLGRDFGPTVEVLEGLQTSDQVILNPADSVVEGSRVKVAKPEATGTK